MSITAIALGGWISVYCGVSLLRTSLRENQPDLGPSELQKRLAAVGYALIAVGVIVLARAFLHRLH